MIEERSDRPILIMAGGTGGHIFPDIESIYGKRQILIVSVLNTIQNNRWNLET